LHANSPEEAVIRMTSLVTMGYPSLQPDVIRAMFASAVDILVQVERLRDGTRKITRISEVEVSDDGEIRLRPLLRFEVGTDDPNSAEWQGGVHRLISAPTEKFTARARYSGESDRLAHLLKQLVEDRTAGSRDDRVSI